MTENFILHLGELYVYGRKISDYTFVSNISDDFGTNYIQN